MFWSLGAHFSFRVSFTSTNHLATKKHYPDGFHMSKFIKGGFRGDYIREDYRD